MTKEKRDSIHKEVVLKLLQYSNNFSLFLIILATYLCFAKNGWFYITLLTFSATYLTYLTTKFIKYDSDQCLWAMHSLKYECQLASFNSRLSIVSNIIVAALGFTLVGVLAGYRITHDNVGITSVMGDFGYLNGFLKLLMMYLVSDKVHTSQMIISILFNRSRSMRHATVVVDKDQPELTYPLIFLNGNRISPERYAVTHGTTENSKYIVGMTFHPPLSLDQNVIIEYMLVREDCDHKVTDGFTCGDLAGGKCRYNCRTVLKRLPPEGVFTN